MQTDTVIDITDPLQGYDPAADSEDYYFDESEAMRSIEFFPQMLVHVKGELANRPFELEPWEAWFVANLRGWKHRKTNLRRYREAFLFVPRGNGKSALAAGLTCLSMFCDDEPGSELYTAAADREQSSIIFGLVAHMVQSNPVLRKRARIYHRSIVLHKGGVSYKPLTSEAKTKHGFSTQFLVVDELHAHDSRELVDVLMTGTGKRRQPTVIHLTTSDYDRISICNEKLDYAVKVRDGLIGDRSFLPLIYRADEADDWTDERTWALANPNIDVSVSREYLERECEKAKAQPAYENTFKRLHLNLKTRTETRLIPMDQWDECSGASGPLEGRVCWGGLDLSATQDITAWVLVFPDNGVYDILCRFWVPAESAGDRERRDRVPYTFWEREGFLKMTDGPEIDQDEIRDAINADGKKYSIQEIGFDPFKASKLVAELDQQDGFEMVQFRQGMLSMAPPTREFLRLLADKRIRHAGNPVLRWMAGNVAGRSDHAENIMPSKAGSTDRIDGIVATIIALGLAIQGDHATASAYAEHGLFSIDL